jgi:N-methylhydantoinase A
VLAGRIRAEWFAGGRLPLDLLAAAQAVADGVAGPLGIDNDAAVVGVGEMVVENMANAARVHAVDRGRDLGGGAMVAFGGAAPLHACRLAERLGTHTVIVPPGAGVGSAIGFLRAPVSYELVRTCHQQLDRFDREPVNRVLEELLTEARLVVSEADGSAALVETLYASMRYRGQGHEIEVELPLTQFGPGDEAILLDAFDRAYRSLYTRVIPGMVAEVLTWRVKVSTLVAPPEPVAEPAPRTLVANRHERVLDPDDGWLDFAVFRRADLKPGDCFAGPALVVEDQTTTVVSPRFDARIDGRDHLVLTAERVTGRNS